MASLKAMAEASPAADTKSAAWVWLPLALVVLFGLGAIGALLKTATYAVEVNAVQSNSLMGNQEAEARLRRAMQWRPDLAEAPRILANRLSQDSPASAADLARRAVALNGRDWQNWQTLALLQLQTGDSAGAEASMRQALLYNHGFASHFALGSLALILGDTVLGREQLLTALDLAPAESVGSVLRELLAIGLSPEALTRELARRPLRVQVFGILALVAGHDSLQAENLFQQLSCGEFDVESCRWASQALLNDDYSRAQTASGLAARQAMLAAQRVWNRSVAMGLEPVGFHVQAETVSNGEFRFGWTGEPLNWTSPGCVNTGIGTDPLTATPGMVFRFDGTEPETCVLAQQWVLVQAQTRYRLSFRSFSEGPGGGAGVGVQIKLPSGVILQNTPVRLDSGWQAQFAEFTVPSGQYLTGLEFFYQRPQGSQLLDNPVWISAVSLQALPATAQP